MPKPPNLSPFIPFPENLDEAKSALKKATLITGAGVAAITIARKFPKSTGIATAALTGFEIVPGKGIKIVPTGAILFAAPQPVGLVPPRVYGLLPESASPKFYAQAVGLFGGRTAVRRKIEKRESEEVARDLVIMQRNLEHDFTDAQVISFLKNARSGDIRTFHFLPESNATHKNFLIRIGELEAERRGLIPKTSFPDDVVFPRRDGGAIGVHFADVVGNEIGELAGAILFADELNRLNPPDP